MVSGSKFEILLVDDNPAELELLQELFRTSTDLSRSCNLHVVSNPRDVIPFLRNPEMHSFEPHLILLDYRMPTDGGMALAELKGDPDYQHIPVVVLTGSVSPRDLCDIYRRGANSCHLKASSLDDSEELVRRITEYWLSTVSTPRCAEHD